MPCVYYHAVRDEIRRETTGVLGYCRGCLSEELRIPSQLEYSGHCVAQDPSGCPVYDDRRRAEKLKANVKGLPHLI